MRNLGYISQRQSSAYLTMDNPWYNIRPRAVVYLFLLLLLYFRSPETQEGSPQQWDPWREGKWRKNKRGKDKWRKDERRKNEWRETRRFSSASQKTNRFRVGWYWSSNSWYNYGSKGYWKSPGQNQVRAFTNSYRSLYKYFYLISVSIKLLKHW